jgi:excisionase family DNA binding protein
MAGPNKIKSMKPEFTVFDNELDSEQQIDELLTVDEVASILKVPKSWIYAHTRKRVGERLPHVKLGKYLRFFEGEVHEFLKRCSRKHDA